MGPWYLEIMHHLLVAFQKWVEVYDESVVLKTDANQVNK